MWSVTALQQLSLCLCLSLTLSVSVSLCLSLALSVSVSVSVSLSHWFVCKHVTLKGEDTFGFHMIVPLMKSEAPNSTRPRMRSVTRHHNIVANFMQERLLIWNYSSATCELQLRRRGCVGFNQSGSQIGSHPNGLPLFCTSEKEKCGWLFTTENVLISLSSIIRSRTLRYFRNISRSISLL